MCDNCVICQEELQKDLGVAVPCGHVFHRQCFSFLKKATCAALPDDENGDGNRNSDSKRNNNTAKCPVCQHKVKHFHKMYVTFDGHNADAMEASAQLRAERSSARLSRENLRLQSRVREIKTFSNETSDLLFRILPKYDNMETRYDKLKREKKHLEKDVAAMEHDNQELVSQWNHYQEQLSLAKDEQIELMNKLEETDAENSDLHDIWKNLEDQLGKTARKKKEASDKLKHKLREREQDLEMARAQITRAKEQKILLKVALKHSQEYAMTLQKQIAKKKTKKKGQHKSKRRESKRSLHGQLHNLIYEAQVIIVLTD